MTRSKHLQNMKKKILLIHTGGTFGMVKDNESGVLRPDMFYESLGKVVPELYDLVDIEIEIPFMVDSSQLNFPHWKQIATIIKEKIDSINGVIITHGTDTLSYTASALSYMLMHVPVPVILTGAQKPLSELRSDARSNLISAVELATDPDIKEVAIYFDDKLMRGNRTVKIHMNHFDAFASPSYPILAKVGIDVEVYRHNLLAPGGLFHVFDKLDNSIAVYKSFPGCTADYFQPGPDVRAVLLVGYGAGTIFLDSEDLLKQIDGWIAAGKLVILMSETRAGKLDPSLYESGSELLKRGVLHTGDMTFEASITKLMFLLGQYKEPALIRKNFTRSLAGEISV
ncbi:MAG: asparaginase [bacterium]|nr:asparaginase [bacterium]